MQTVLGEPIAISFLVILGSVSLPFVLRVYVGRNGDGSLLCRYAVCVDFFLSFDVPKGRAIEEYGGE